MTNQINFAEALLSFEQCIEQTAIEIENIEKYLADPRNGQGLFTVAMRILGTDGTYSTETGLRSVGQGFNFAGTTPSTIFALDYQDARLNCQHFATQAHRAGKLDVDYQVMGLRHLLLKQKFLKEDVLENMRKMVEEAKARHAA